ncbi:unnamed protein product [Xylocopa violacea]|uniref:Uncharacterized protein n=1 Tax=Xylocopa violacea TaxID=135666 RepID=A0ABP1NDB0_XYLVO
MSEVNDELTLVEYDEKMKKDTSYRRVILQLCWYIYLDSVTLLHFTTSIGWHRLESQSLIRERIRRKTASTRPLLTINHRFIKFRGSRLRVFVSSYGLFHKVRRSTGIYTRRMKFKVRQFCLCFLLLVATISISEGRPASQNPWLRVLLEGAVTHVGEKIADGVLEEVKKIDISRLKLYPPGPFLI